MPEWLNGTVSKTVEQVYRSEGSNPSLSAMKYLAGIAENVDTSIGWGCSSAGRAPRSQRGGRRFESDHLHQICSIAFEIVLDGEVAVPCTRKSALAGSNSCPRACRCRRAFDAERGVDGQVPRNGNLRTPSGPEGSSGTQPFGHVPRVSLAGANPAVRAEGRRSRPGARSPYRRVGGLDDVLSSSSRESGGRRPSPRSSARSTSRGRSRRPSRRAGSPTRISSRARAGAARRRTARLLAKVINC